MKIYVFATNVWQSYNWTQSLSFGVHACLENPTIIKMKMSHQLMHWISKKAFFSRRSIVVDCMLLALHACWHTMTIKSCIQRPMNLNVLHIKINWCICIQTNICNVLHLTNMFSFTSPPTSTPTTLTTTTQCTAALEDATVTTTSVTMVRWAL